MLLWLADALMALQTTPMTRPHPLPLLCALLIACASTSSTELEELPVPHGDSRTITLSDIASATQLNLQDFIVAERPNWLRTPTGRVPAVTVYIGDTRLGGISTLAGITLTDVRLVRYYDASASQQKFNVATLGPVIQVMTR